MTESIKSPLALALSKVQGQLEGAKKDSVNPFFKSSYADLASVWASCRKLLYENEIAVFQGPEARDGEWAMGTTLVHSSGESLKSFWPMGISKASKPQEIGTAGTYARRYGLAAAVGIYQEDDDGQDASKPTAKKEEVKSPPKAENLGEQLKEMVNEIGLADTSEKLDSVVKRFAVTTQKVSVSNPVYHKDLLGHIEKKRKTFMVGA